jgi:flagellar hook-associated protein FlgK
MRAAQLRLDTAAHNIANAQTPGFQRQGVTQTAQPGLGGVRTQITQETPGDAASGDSGRLVEDVVAQRMSVYSFAANLRTVQAQDRMLGSLLDIRA